MRNSLSFNIFNKIRSHFGKKYIDGYEPLLNKTKNQKYNLKEDINTNNYDCIYVLTNHKIFRKN